MGPRAPSQPQCYLAGPLETHPQSAQGLEPPISSPAQSCLSPSAHSWLPHCPCAELRWEACAPPFMRAPQSPEPSPAPSQASLSGLRLNQKDSP